MGTKYTYSIEVWAEVFKQFRQVDCTIVDYSAERLDVTIKNRKDILQVSREELDSMLYKYIGTPYEVVMNYLSNNGVIDYYRNTLVGFFDIMGYSSFIGKKPIEEAIRKISNFFKYTTGIARTDIHDVKLDHWILSDSVIIVVDTNRQELFSGSLEAFLWTCSMIMREGMRNGFPLRGAVGGGDFYKDGEIMVSPALVEAVNKAKKQEWLGAILTPKALQMMVEKAIDFSSDRFNQLVRNGAIPWKLGEAEQGKSYYYIKPDMAEADWADKYLPDYFDKEKKREMISNSHDLYSQK